MSELSQKIKSLEDAFLMVYPERTIEEIDIPDYNLELDLARISEGAKK